MMSYLSKYWVYALLSGLLMALSWPTYGFAFLMFFAWIPLLLMEHEISISLSLKKKALRIWFYSFLCFLLFNGITISWLYKVEVNRGEAYFMPLIANALLMSWVFLLYHYLKKSLGTLWGIIAFPCLWIAFEKMHLEWQLNWPWLNLGNVFADYHPFIQWYEFTGTLGGTLWILVLNVLGFYFVKLYLVSRNFKYLQKILLYYLLGIGIPSGFSWYLYESYQEKGEEINVLLLQPEIDPYHEKYELPNEIIVSQLAELMQQGNEHTQLIIAPETAFPGLGSIDIKDISKDSLIAYLRRNLPNPQSALISGVDVFEKVEKDGKDVNYDPRSATYFKQYNAVIQLDKSPNTPLYYKSKLVPMVEYFSYRNILKPLLGKFMLDFGGSTNTLSKPSQPKIFTNDYNAAKVAPTVCYESIFGEYTSEFVKKGANLLAISTNDSWWQDSQGHKQLLAYAKLRAIENRRDIARSANSGISAFINQKGDITASLPYLYKGSLYGTVKLNTTLTYYSQKGDYIARIALLMLGIILGFALSQFFLKFFRNKK